MTRRDSKMIEPQVKTTMRKGSEKPLESQEKMTDLKSKWGMNGDKKSFITKMLISLI